MLNAGDSIGPTLVRSVALGVTSHVLSHDAVTGFLGTAPSVTLDWYPEEGVSVRNVAAGSDASRSGCAWLLRSGQKLAPATLTDHVAWLRTRVPSAPTALWASDPAVAVSLTLLVEWEPDSVPTFDQLLDELAAPERANVDALRREAPAMTCSVQCESLSMR
jgi:hypothetical protein